LTQRNEPRLTGVFPAEMCSDDLPPRAGMTPSEERMQQGKRGMGLRQTHDWWPDRVDNLK